jgi:hypothetical protein
LIIPERTQDGSSRLPLVGYQPQYSGVTPLAVNR